MSKRKPKPRPPMPVTIDGHSMPSLGAWAAAATVDTSTLAKILSEGREPKHSTATKLAGAIGVSTDRLFRWLHEERRAS